MKPFVIEEVGELLERGKGLGREIFLPLVGLIEGKDLAD